MLPLRENGKVDSKEGPVRELTLPVEKLVYGGAGLSRHEGRVVLTPFVLPGETVRIAVEREKKDVIEGRPMEILERAEARTAARCRVFGRCGGCHYQHALYDEQVEMKKSVLREVLQRIGKLTPPEKIATVAGEPWGYRNRIQLHIEGQRVGYREAGSRRVVDTSECPVSSPKLNEALRALRRMVRSHRFPRFVQSIELFSNERDVQINVMDTEGGQRVARGFFDWCEAEIPGAATGPIEYETNGFKFRVHFKSFFQVNRFLMEDLVRTALGTATGRTAVELYAGVGLFSLPLADRFERVEAVESVKAATEDLEFNSRRARKTIAWKRANAEEALRERQETPDLVLADPPRAGLGPMVIKELLRLKPPAVRIVSCDPATLARDLQGLYAGGYRIADMTLIDMFPHTFHLETVTGLELA